MSGPEVALECIAELRCSRVGQAFGGTCWWAAHDLAVACFDVALEGVGTLQWLQVFVAALPALPRAESNRAVSFSRMALHRADSLGRH